MTTPPAAAPLDATEAKRFLIRLAKYYDDRFGEGDQDAALLRTLAAALDRIAEDARDAERWRKLVALVQDNSRRTALGGGVVLWTMDANVDNGPEASIQALDHENPRGTVWMSSAPTIDDAIDAAIFPDDAVAFIAGRADPEPERE